MALALDQEGGAPCSKLWLLMLTRNLWLIACAIGVVMFVGSVAFDIVVAETSRRRWPS